MTNIVHEQSAINQDVAHAAVELEALEVRLKLERDRSVAIRERYKRVLQDMPEWSEADGMSATMENDTKKEREEISRLMKAARDKADATEDGREWGRQAELVRSLKREIAGKRQNAMQMLMPFVGAI